MSGSTKRIVSRMARPAVIDPPGELIYSEMSFFRVFRGQKKHLGDHRLAKLSSMACLGK